MLYDVLFAPAAERQLAKLARPAREMILASIVALASNPRPTGCVKLEGAESLWRVRVRDYRVVYQITDRQLLVTVVKIGHRKDVYR
ncbi:MAG TPA: type II toxin-antitoxin system RelE/ParE family toxin [Vicinamibacterales bacterium]